MTIIETLGHAGAEQALVNLLPALRSRGCECEVVVLWPPYDLAETLERQGVTVHRLDLRHRWGAAECIAKLTAICRRKPFDIIHAHLFFAGLYSGLSKAFAPGPRRVVSFHNVDYDLFPATTLIKMARKMFHRWVMQSCIDGHAAVSGAVAEHYRVHLGLTDVKVIPNAFPTELVRADPSLDRQEVLARYGIESGDFVIALAARLVSQKGHIYCLQALDLLRRRGLRPKALFLGKGPLVDAIGRAIAEHDLQSQVTLCGAVSHSVLMRIVQAADAFVFPSLHEGFGLAPAEAMLLERPVVATDIAALRDVVESGVSGLLVPPADPAALADGIERLMSDPDLRRQLGTAGRERIVRHFSTEVVAEQWHQFYQELSGRRSNREIGRNGEGHSSRSQKNLHGLSVAAGRVERFSG